LDFFLSIIEPLVNPSSLFRSVFYSMGASENQLSTNMGNRRLFPAFQEY
jgi:hypothetical protein